MARGGGGSQRWLLTYSDMITLMMVFFVMLFSTAQIDLKKYRRVAESLQRAFGGSGAVIVPISEEEGGAWESEYTKPVLIEAPTISYGPSDVSAELGDAIARAGIEGQVSVRTHIEGVIISLSEDLIFPPGSAELQPKGREALDDIASVLHAMPNAVRVEGHTDDRPTDNPDYPTNWELSTARAVSIVRYLIEKGISPSRLSAAGMASYQPLVPNDTPDQRAMNRRANLVIIYPIDSREFQVNLLPELEEIKSPITGSGQ
jgi:chemotaxis protein MotB